MSVHGDVIVVSREDEMGVLRAGLARASPSAVLLVGEAGIGKTTVWEAGVEAARSAGRLILSCTASGAETQLSFAALGDLLEGVVHEVAPAIPPPQRRALAAALLLEDTKAATYDIRAVGLGLLNSLRALARNDRLLVAVDDLQWLDAPSAAALDFALRRLRDGSVLVLAAARRGLGLPLELERMLPTRRVEIGPLGLGALHHVIRLRLGFLLPRRELRRIYEISGGNPFYAVELARTLQRHGEIEAIVLPESLEQLVRDRLEVLPEPTRSTLFDVAALAEPTVDLVESRALEPAVEAQVVTLVGDEIRFTHPLLASAAYARASPPQRRTAHARLAHLAPTREERARHLALATAMPDERVADELAAVALEAVRRGAAAAGAELLEHALRLTPVTEVEPRAFRTLAAADAHLAAGDWQRARALLRAGLAQSEPVFRAEAAARLATWVLEDVRAGIELCEKALGELPREHAVRSRLLVALCESFHLLGDHASAIERAREALAEAERGEDERALAVALGYLGMFEVITAQGDPVEHLQRAQDLRGEDQRLLPVHPGTWLGLRHLFRHELAEARVYLEAEHVAAVKSGDDAQRSAILLHLCELEWRLGDWQSALRHAEEGYDLAEQVGDEQGRGALLYARALVNGSLGRIEESRAATAEGLGLAASIDDRLFPAMHGLAAGARELSLGRYEDALAHFASVAAFDEQAVPIEPGITLYHADAIEALVALGRLTEADELVERLELRGRELDRPHALADAARGRALVLAARGDLEGAVESLERSLSALDRIDAPFARARTQLVLGVVLRRAKKRGAARTALDQAAVLFEHLGAEVWQKRVHAERARISGRPPSDGTLTETERRVAQLVAEGRSNKEVATALFVTVRTVESNLTRIYEKLGVKSRAELANRLSAK